MTPYRTIATVDDERRLIDRIRERLADWKHQRRMRRWKSAADYIARTFWAQDQ